MKRPVSEKISSAVAIILVLGMACCALVALLGYEGLILSLLWEWYVVPLGFGHLKIVSALMVLLIARVVLWQTNYQDNRDRYQRSRDSLATFKTKFIGWSAVFATGYVLSFVV